MTNNVLKIIVDQSLTTFTNYSLLYEGSIACIDAAEVMEQPEYMLSNYSDMSRYLKEIGEAHSSLIAIVQRYQEENYYRYNIERPCYKFTIQIGKNNHIYKRLISLWIPKEMIQLIKEVIHERFNKDTEWTTNHSCIIDY